MGKSGGTQTTTQKADPWVGQQPSLYNYYGMLNDATFGPQGSQYTGGSGSGGGNGSGNGFLKSRANNIVDPNSQPSYQDRTGWMDIAKQNTAALDPKIQEAWNMKEAIARANPNQGAVDMADKTLGGYFLNNNPYIDATFNKGANEVQSRINSQFGLAGRTGSGAHQGVMQTGMNNLATDIYGGNYNNERNRQMQMFGMTPQLDALRYGTANTLGDIGNQQMAYNQSQLDIPMNAIAKYGSLLNPGSQYGTTTSTQPYSSNTGSTLGSLLGMGVGFGLGGIPGAMLGGQAGGMGGSLFNR